MADNNGFTRELFLHVFLAPIAGATLVLLGTCVDSVLAVITVTSIVLSLLFAYMLIILIVCAKRSNPNHSKYGEKYYDGWIPTRVNAIFMVLGFVGLIIVGFANFYHINGDAFHVSQTDLALKEDYFGAVYYSTVTLTTVGYGDIHPKCFMSQLLVMLQMGMGTMLLLCIFPLLASRISTFPDLPLEPQGRDTPEAQVCQSEPLATAVTEFKSAVSTLAGSLEKDSPLSQDMQAFKDQLDAIETRLGAIETKLQEEE